ncbi:hypothetical protein YC2023_063483 [Brassica napus]
MLESGEVELALWFFSLAKDKGLIIPPRFIFCFVKALARKKKAEESKVLLQEMISRGSYPGNEVFNVVVYVYSRNGDPDGASEATRELMNQAQEILAEAKQKHDKLYYPTHQALIQGYFKTEQSNKILKLFQDRYLFGVKARGDEYTKLIQFFCLIAMDWRIAEMLRMEMNLKDMQLDPISKEYIDSLKNVKYTKNLIYVLYCHLKLIKIIVSL